MTKISHRDARILICEGYRKLFGGEPPRAVAQLAQSVAWLEANYGAGWRPHVWEQLRSKYGDVPMFPTWGAITAGKEWSGKTFEHKDSYPDHKNPKADKNGNVWYSTAFRVHDTAADAAKDLVRIVYLAEPKGYQPRHKTVLPAALAGDPYAFSAAMYDSGYYRGFGKTREERIAGHHKAVMNALARICKALGEDPPNKINAAEFNAALATAESEVKSNAELRALALEAPLVDTRDRSYHQEPSTDDEGGLES